MDYKSLPIGIDKFEMLITRGYYFIDKLHYIKKEYIEFIRII